MVFQPNLGQLPEPDEFMAHTPDYLVRLAKGGTARFSGQAKGAAAEIWMEPVSSSGATRGVAERTVDGVVHYYRGDDPRNGLPGFLSIP